jgi:hypothetical protein
VEHVGFDRRVVLVADDLAALDEQLVVGGDANRLPGLRLARQGGVPGLDALDPRRLVGG